MSQKNIPESLQHIITSDHDVTQFQTFSDLVQQEFGSIIQEFVASGDTHLYLESLPIEKLIGDEIDESALNLFLFALGTAFGTVFSYSNHRDGKLIFDIVPLAADAGEQLGTGTQLDWHTDDAHAPDQCDFICLLCIQGDPNALTLVTNNDWFQHVPIATQETLTQDAYTIRADKSYKGAEPLKTPIIKKDETGEIELRFDPQFTTAEDETEMDALRSLETVFEANSTSVALKPRDFLVINNKTAAHARSNFDPTYERKNDRWLKRVIVKKN